MNDNIFELFYKTELPLEGWFQACTICGIITSNLKYYKTLDNGYKKEDSRYKELKLMSYMCHHCLKNSNTDFYKEELCYNSDKIIEENIYTISKLIYTNRREIVDTSSSVDIDDQL